MRRDYSLHPDMTRVCFVFMQAVIYVGIGKTPDALAGISLANMIFSLKYLASREAPVF